MKEDIIYIVFDGLYEDFKTILVTANLDNAIKESLNTECGPYVEVWKNEKLIIAYGSLKEHDTSSYKSVKEGIEKAIQEG